VSVFSFLPSLFAEDSSPLALPFSLQKIVV